MKRKTNISALVGTLLIGLAALCYLAVDYSIAAVLGAAGVMLFIVGVVQEAEK